MRKLANSAGTYIDPGLEATPTNNEECSKNMGGYTVVVSYSIMLRAFQTELVLPRCRRTRQAVESVIVPFLGRLRHNARLFKQVMGDKSTSNGSLQNGFITDDIKHFNKQPDDTLQLLRL